MPPKRCRDISLITDEVAADSCGCERELRFQPDDSVEGELAASYLCIVLEGVDERDGDAPES
jgi:hypothetical protein